MVNDGREESFAEDIARVGRIAAVPRILDVVCQITGMGFATVARVTEGRWIACGVHDTIGFGAAPGSELEVDTTICREVRVSRAPVVIADVEGDVVYRAHPTPKQYAFQSYLSVPIVMPDGSIFGTLCALGRAPAAIDGPEVVGMFRLFAELIAFHLDADRKLAASAAALLTEQQASELREQFIAVLGHDLRNPLAAISAGSRLLLRAEPDERSVRIIGMMQQSVARMSKLIGNVMDFARARLGGGFDLDWETVALEETLTQIVDEMRTSWPGREVETAFDLPAPVTCDPGRLGQLLSNLLANALTHGGRERPVRVAARVEDGWLRLSVANSGAVILPDAMARLFQPFARGVPAREGAGHDQAGLGLGLHIAGEIARAHGGALSATSDETETCFVLRMPVG